LVYIMPVVNVKVSLAAPLEESERGKDTDVLSPPP
jgi:hypothetical protein